jgi:hypothetical protein
MIQQIDVKDVYLNGTLKETLYMHQLDSFNNGSGRVYHLIKSLYGLKQSSHKWNAEFDTKIRQKG